MKKYIDADVLFVYMKTVLTGNDLCTPHGIEGFVYSLPAADVAEMVRCKDCKHRDDKDGLCTGRGWPMQLVPYDGFCDKGERREE